MPVMTGARAFLEMLRAEGMDTIFGNPGTSESAIMALLPEYPDLRYLLATQEGVAMGMADGYAVSGKRPAVVNLHIETGLANGISLLHHAMDGGVPLVLTAGNKDIRKLAEGRSDLVEMVRQFTKWSAEVTHPEQVPGVVRRAFQEAKSPPTGPVFVGFAANALDGEAEVTITPSTAWIGAPTPSASAVEEAAVMLAGSVCPVMLVGDRLAQAEGTDAAVKVAEKLGARVYATSIARANFPSGHSQFLGRINPTLPAGRQLLADADVILAVGANVFSGFFYVSGSSLSPGTKLIHLDSSLRDIGRVEPTDLALFGDPRAGLEMLEDALAGQMDSAANGRAAGRRRAVQDMKALNQAGWEENLRKSWGARPMSPERMMHELGAVLPSNAIVVDDSLSSKDALHGAVKFNEADSIYGERIGAIGWGMGAGLGVKLANPDRPVLAVTGDGSAMMTVQALWTAANCGIPTVYLVCNNRSYRILKLNMNVHQREILGRTVEEGFEGYVGMDFPLPLNIAGIAEAIGVYGRTITDPEEIGPEIRRALDSGRPAVLDVVIDGRL
ncbi:MAG: thiamine pyrophosphate-binding protein [Chloroflexota bacterium]|nr:thiamine pyrophosphate-binding protein [Chloroflexota bacterium]